MNVDYYNGISGIYFSNIISNIIKIGNLDKTQKIILDFGCGSKILKKNLPGKKTSSTHLQRMLQGVQDSKN